MNFKDAYRREYENVRTDAEFRSRLAAKMNNTAPKSRNIKIYTAVAASAAVVALAVGVALKGVSSNENAISVQGETVTAPAVTEGLFSVPQWYGEAETDEEIYAAFAELLESGTLEKLYCTHNDTFAEEDIVAESEMNGMAEKLLSAVITDEELTGDITECMAVFSGGEIVKFRISENGLIKLKDAEAVYRYE